MPTGKSIAGKRARGQLGSMAQAQHQKVGRVCLGGSSAGTQGSLSARWVPGAWSVSHAILSGDLGLGALLVQAVWAEAGRSKQPL